MARIKYATVKMGPDRLRVVDQATEICEGYAAQGLSLTLRQVYYQFVARGLMENKQTNYKRLGEILNDARMGGLFDWDFLIDRTRNLVDLSHWDSPAAIIKGSARGYRTDLWKPQKQRVEVWIEKDAGIGVIEAVCQANDVPYFSCRGYTSASELWAAAQRVGDRIRHGERVTILHVGDHDPSGLDMTRDMQKRMATFIYTDWFREFGGSSNFRAIAQSMREGMRLVGGTITDTQAPYRIKRIALTIEQVEEYQPPPNPAKTTDSRFERYAEETGLDESWELDALDPFVLQDLIHSEIEAVRDADLWERTERKQEVERALLTKVSEKWTEIADRYRDEIPGLDDTDDTDETEDDRDV